MIYLKEFIKFDKSFDLIHSNEIFAIKGICKLDDPIEYKFFYIKNNKYFKRIAAGKFLKSGILFEKKFFKTLDEKDVSDLTNRYGFVATIDSFEKSICAFSKFFYDQATKDLNYFLDGRKIGSAQVDPNAEIAEGVFIGDGARVEAGARIYPGVKIMPKSIIGENVTIYPNTVIYPFVKIGKNTIIHANTTIGADGFGYNFFNGKHNKIWHYGGVKIGENVEIGSSTCIDAGVFYPTKIGNETKIDNLVQIAHNIEIGEYVIICGQTGMGGSARVSNYCVFGAKSGLGPDIYLPPKVQVAGNAQVTGAKNYEEGSTLAGHPAREINEWLKAQAYLRSEALKR